MPVKTTEIPDQSAHHVIADGRQCLLLSLLVAAIVFFCVPQSMADPDIWWHLRDAQIQLASHSFLSRDLYSFTAASAPWMNHEWFAELPFYAGFRLAGDTGIYVVTLLTIEAIFMGALYLAWKSSKSLVAATCATAVGVLLSTVSFGPRTLLFGWILLVGELVILDRSREDARVLWGLPLLFMVWINTHGSWLIGIVLFTLWIACRSFSVDAGLIENVAVSREHRKRLLQTWSACLVALFANPYGWHLVLYPFDLAFRQKLNVANVEEWKSLDFHSPRGRILFLCLILFFVFQLLRRRRWTLPELAFTGVGLYSALTYSRFLFLAAILVMPVLARSLSAGRADEPPRVRRRPTLLITLSLCFFLLCLVYGRLRTQERNATVHDSRFPGTALAELKTHHPHGRVFNEFLWGGYLIWNVHDVPVFIDSRVDIFEYNGTFKDYLDVVRLKNSLGLLDQHQIDWVVFERDSPLVYLLKTSGKWQTDYEDATTAVLERVHPVSSSR